jgi:hypothetical protein
MRCTERKRRVGVADSTRLKCGYCGSKVRALYYKGACKRCLPFLEEKIAAEKANRRPRPRSR